METAHPRRVRRQTKLFHTHRSAFGNWVRHYTVRKRRAPCRSTAARSRGRKTLRLSIRTACFQCAPDLGSGTRLHFAAAAAASYARVRTRAPNVSLAARSSAREARRPTRPARSERGVPAQSDPKRSSVRARRTVSSLRRGDTSGHGCDLDRFVEAPPGDADLVCFSWERPTLSFALWRCSLDQAHARWTGPHQ